METSPVTCRMLEDFYYIDGHTFEKQYKAVLSGYRTWSELSHADEWLVFPENIGPNLAIDETSLSNGELYTIVTNRDRHGGEGCLLAVVSGTKSDDVITALESIPEEEHEKVLEVTLAHLHEAAGIREGPRRQDGAGRPERQARPVDRQDAAEHEEKEMTKAHICQAKGHK